MSDLPEIRAEIDERGRMTYHAMGAAVLLSKDEQDEILRKFADLQSENAKLRELLAETVMPVDEYAEKYGIELSFEAVNAHLDARMRELGVEVD